MEYFILCISAFLLVLALNFKRQHRKLVPTGRIPDAVTAKRRATITLVLAAFSAIAFVALRQLI
jgi:hypothetical protein